MTDMKPRGDAEAVLSSVRRIVSEIPGVGDAVPSAASGERLLLTPALRVDVSTGEPAPKGSGTRGQTRKLTAERISLEQRIAELERAVGDAGDWEPDGSEPGDAETPKTFVLESVHRVEETEQEVDRLDDAPVADRPEPPLVLHPGMESDRVAPAPADPEPAVPDRSQEEPQRLRSAPSPVRPEPITPRPRPVPAAESEPLPSEAPLPATAPGVDLDERVIDEEMLRDIVSEIVRSELQGELGERITRNVRKLVRREIHRAIMTRDFGG